MDPVVLARIGNLELVARAVCDGFINGLHKAPYFGASVDFAEHRGYVPGDDIRRMDWRLWARTDRYYIKEYEAETNMNFSVLLDVSKSMDYGSRGITKLDYARILTACLTNLVHHQRDRVGFVAFDSEIVEHVPPSAKHMDTVLHVLDRLKAGRPGGRMREPLHKVAEHFGRRGVLVVISDFYEDPEEIVDAVTPLRFRGNDLVVFHVLDPAELEFGFTDAQAFEDLESGEQMPVVPDAMRKEYVSLVQRAHRRAAAAVLRSAGRLHAARHVEAARSRALSSIWAAARRRCAEIAEVAGSWVAMNFIAPLFFVALAGLAIPVLIHLIQREKKQIMHFPSLMFVQRIPYKSIQRRRIHNWLLLIVRLAALALIIAGVRAPVLRAAGRCRRPGTGAREVVVLLDQSYSMGYGDRWERARAAAHDAINGLGAADRGSVVLFSSGAEIALRSTASGERERLTAAVAAAKTTRRRPRATRRRSRWPAASWRSRRSRGARSCSISDFQRGGWRGEEGARLPAGVDGHAGVDRRQRRGAERRR